MKKVAIVLIGLLLSTGALAGNPHDNVSCPCEFGTIYEDAPAVCVVSYTVSKGKETTHELYWLDSIYGENFAGVIKLGNAYGCRADLYPGTQNEQNLALGENMSHAEYVACVAELDTIATLAIEDVGICQGM